MKKIRYLFFAIIFLLIMGLTLEPIQMSLRRFALPILSPILSPFWKSGVWLRNSFGIFGRIRALSERNLELSQKISNLEVDRSKILELEYENGLLKRELGLIKEDSAKELIPARIIGREPTSFLDYAIINRGEEDGVLKGAAVLANGVFVGHISEVANRESKVILITSKDSLIQAMLQNSRSKGVLRGGISGLVLENVSQDVEFEAGEHVVTSGLGGRFKEGILIGRAVSLHTAGSNLFRNIAVEPIIDLGKLEMVFVVK